MVHFLHFLPKKQSIGKVQQPNRCPAYCIVKQQENGFIAYLKMAFFDEKIKKASSEVVNNDARLRLVNLQILQINFSKFATKVRYF